MPHRQGSFPASRREFITLLGGAAAAWPLAARAQQPGVPVIGYLGNGSPEATAHLVAAFRKGLSESGYVEGRNVAIEFRWTHNDDNRLAELAADLVRRRVTAIATPGSIATALPVQTQQHHSDKQEITLVSREIGFSHAH
jgi:putative ABC transport system substrate-binding protein